MSSYEDRRREDLELMAGVEARRKARIANARLRRNVSVANEPPPYTCIICLLSIDDCRCEKGE